jgi:hypothetical protein
LGQLSDFGRAAFCALWSTFLHWASCILPAWGNFPALGELPSARNGQPFLLWGSCLLTAWDNFSALGELPFARWSTVPALAELPSARNG